MLPKLFPPKHVESDNVIIIISKFIKRHVCLQKAAEALVWYRSDGLVTAIKQECLKMSFKTMFRIAQLCNANYLARTSKVLFSVVCSCYMFITLFVILFV